MEAQFKSRNTKRIIIETKKGECGVYEELERKTTLRSFLVLTGRSYKGFSQFIVPARINFCLKPEI